MAKKDTGHFNSKGGYDILKGEYNPFDRAERHELFDVIHGPNLKGGNIGQVVYFTVNVKGVIEELKEIERTLQYNVLNALFKKLADNSTRRMRRNVSAAKLSDSKIERHRGRVYDTIGSKITQTDEGPHVIMGAIKGTAWGRQIASVHDEPFGTDTVIRVRPGNRAGGWMLIPGRIAMDSRGDQILGASDLKILKSQGSIYKYWNTDEAIWVAKKKGGRPEVAFFKHKSVTVPGRAVISQDFPKAQADLERLLPTTIEASLELKRVRI